MFIKFKLALLDSEKLSGPEGAGNSGPGHGNRVQFVSGTMKVPDQDLAWKGQ